MPSKTRKAALLPVITILCTWCIETGAQSWQYLPDWGLPSTPRFEDIYFTDTNTGYAVYLANYSSFDYAAKPIYKTIDGSANWGWIGPAIYGSSALRSIEFLGDRNTGIAGSLLGSVYRTTDAGAHWMDISGTIIDTLNTTCKIPLNL